MPHTQDELILQGGLYSYYETVQLDHSLDNLLEALIESIDYIENIQDKLSRPSTDLLCCISACAYAISQSHPKIVDRNKGINWSKLALFKREIMFEGVNAKHRSRPQIDRIESNIEQLTFALILSALPDIIREDLPQLKMAFINIRSNNDFQQTNPIGIQINKLMDYLYDESLLLIISRRCLEIILAGQTDNIANSTIAHLYRILTIGEALNKLSSCAFFSLPSAICEKLIQARNILCHPERDLNRKIIENIVEEGNKENPAINLIEITNEITVLREAVSVLIRQYREDGSNLTSQYDPKVKVIWERIKSKNYIIPNEKDRELKNVLYTHNLVSIQNYLEKYAEHYDGISYARQNNLIYLRNQTYITSFERDLLDLYPQIELRYYKLRVFFDNYSPESFLVLRNQFEQERTKLTIELEDINKRLEKKRKKLDAYLEHFREFSNEKLWDSSTEYCWSNMNLSLLELHRGNYEINIDKDYPTLLLSYIEDYKVKDKLEANLEMLITLNDKEQAIRLLTPLIKYIEKILGGNFNREEKRFFQVMAGSYARALLEGDRHSGIKKNIRFIEDAMSIDIGEHILFSDRLNLANSLRLFAQETRGYLSHLGQAQIGTTKRFDSPRWPLRESKLVIELMQKCLEPLTNLSNTYIHDLQQELAPSPDSQWRARP